ncbi:ABC transporter permease [Saccharospirillum salsuginis]|uniref:ABC transporter permease n=1 Tax=Saccharospirillum salsuginis TaxID=418750 RepID=A0A918NFN8_9GAMM|nr:ABC transporter permease [Saccharospirillum salsuginis]GGX64094.1 ABC transporter permease [Saccharospirillum salsuginis]
MGLTWRLALRNLMRNKRRTFLTAMIISLSLTALILTDAFIEGMSDAMVRSATRLYSGDAQIHHRDYLAQREESLAIDPDPFLEKLTQETDVSGYAPRVLAFGMISSAANNRAIQVSGIDPDREATVSKLRGAIRDGNYLDSDGPRTQILIGSRLADLLEVELGDRIVVSVNNQDTQGAEQQLFRVSGIFHFNARALDENTAFVLLPRLQEMMGLGESVHEIAFNFEEANQATQTDRPIWSRLSTDTAVAQGWTELMPQLATMLQLSNSSTLIAAVILFILAGLGVINGMFMSIYERTYEFGVLLAIGTRRTSIFRLILAEGLVLAVGAITIGAILGVVVTATMAAVGIDYGNMEISGVSIAEVIRPEYHINQYTVLPVWVLIMTLIACVYPAVHAARIVPAHALHKSL